VYDRQNESDSCVAVFAHLKHVYYGDIQSKKKTNKPETGPANALFPWNAWLQRRIVLFNAPSVRKLRQVRRWQLLQVLRALPLPFSTDGNAVIKEYQRWALLRCYFRRYYHLQECTIKQEKKRLTSNFCVRLIRDLR